MGVKFGFFNPFLKTRCVYVKPQLPMLTGRGGDESTFNIASNLVMNAQLTFGSSRANCNNFLWGITKNNIFKSLPFSSRILNRKQSKTRNGKLFIAVIHDKKKFLHDSECFCMTSPWQPCHSDHCDLRLQKLFVYKQAIFTFSVLVN